MTYWLRSCVGGIAALTVMALVAGCEGDSGDRGEPGPQGEPGPPGPSAPPPDVSTATEISAEITGVTIASPPVVAFSLSGGAGEPLGGLQPESISFSIAKLTPGTDGNASAWQSYINRVEEADGTEPDVLDEALQATTESGADGTLEDNGDGTYVYTFATDVANVPDVSFDPTLTHRVGFEIRGLVPVDNPTYTLRPSDGATTGIFTRDIAKTETCNDCHDPLALHGNARFEMNHCVICHNPGSTDQDSGNTVDMTVMTHKIHMGEDLPSVQAGEPYVIYGFRESEHDYSDVVFPQDIRNCRNCHDENDPDTPDAANWLNVPTAEACGSCHDDVNFETGEGHSDSNLAVTNADCAVCHRDGGLVGGVDESHEIPEQTGAEAFQYNIVDVTDFGPGLTPSVTFSVTDPTNADTPYDIQNDPAFTQGFGASRLAVLLGWDNLDFTNAGSGSADMTSGTPSQPISLDPLFGGSTANGDGTFTVVSATPIPADVSGSGTVAIEGHPAADVTGDGSAERLPVTGAAEPWPVTDASAVARRQVVELERCNDCHQQLSLHGANRTDNILLCDVCHTADATDINRRASAGIDASNAPDGKDEESVDFKTMVHAIHAPAIRESGIIVYGFGGSENDFSHVLYPGNLANCEACHLENTFYPVSGTVLATTTDTGGDRSDPLDDINTTPSTAACASCHDGSLAQAHMEQNGGAFDAMQLADGTLVSESRGTVVETCSICHGPSQSADVREVHGF